MKIYSLIYYKLIVLNQDFSAAFCEYKYLIKKIIKMLYYSQVEIFIYLLAVYVGEPGVYKIISIISSSTFLYGYLAMTFEMSSKWLKKSINYFLI